MTQSNMPPLPDLPAGVTFYCDGVLYAAVTNYAINYAREAVKMALASKEPSAQPAEPKERKPRDLNRCGCDHWTKPVCPERGCKWNAWRDIQEQQL